MREKKILKVVLGLFVLLATFLFLPDKAFAVQVEDGDWVYEVNGTAIVSKYNGTASSIEIPSTVYYGGMEYDVVGIGNEAFLGNESLKNVILPTGITSIGRCAFKNCINLVSLDINGNLEDADNYSCTSQCENYSAFYNAGTASEGITVTFGESVTRVPALLFATGVHENLNVYPHVTKVVLNDKIESIGNAAFHDCFLLSDINFEEAVSLKTIGSYSFQYCASIEKVILPQGVTSLGELSFGYARRLKKVILPSSVTKLGDNAFRDCISLVSLDINGNLEDASKYSCTSSCENYSVFYRAGTESEGITVTFGKGVTRVPGYLFATGVHEKYNVYPHVTKVVLSDTIESTGYASFHDCFLLADINFEEATALKTIGEYSFQYNASIKKVILPQGVTSIGTLAFGQSGSIETVVLPKSLTKIGAGAFTDCLGLKEITINGDVENLSSSSEVFYNAGRDVEGITVNFVEGVTKVPAYLFSTSGTVEEENFANVVTVNVPNTVISIGLGAFNNCYNLTEARILESVNSIGSNTFNNCGGLAIHGVAGSYAEEYANENSIRFIDINHIHNYKEIISKASTTDKTTGTYSKICADCGFVKVSRKVNYANKITLSRKEFGYDNTEKKPNIEVWDSAGKKIDESQYTIVYKDNVDIGTATVVVTLQGRYEGEFVENFTIFNKMMCSRYYFDNTIAQWDSVYVWAWSESDETWGERNGFTDWPGIEITKDKKTGYYVWECYENIDDLSVLFNSAGNIQINDDAAINARDGYVCRITTVDSEKNYNAVWELAESAVCTEHTWGKGKITKEATCKNKGVMTYICTADGCKATKTEEVDKNLTKHEGATEVRSAKFPTCTEKGYTGDTYCTSCGTIVLAGEEIVALGHSMTKLVSSKINPTCTVKGKAEVYGCSQCEYEEGGEEIEALGHDFSSEYTVDKEATCTVKGIKSKHCSRCDEKTEVTEIVALGHDFSSEYTVDKGATCIEAGNKSKHCSRCDEKTEVTEIPALGHTWDAGKITKEATCTEKGIKTYTCKVEGCNVTKTEEIAALGHDFSSEFTVDKEATSTEPGIKSKHCSRCDEKIEVTEIPALGHVWDAGKITKEATCTEKGIKTYTCKVEGCNVTKTEEIAALGHDFSSEFTVDKEATSTEPGSKSKHCSRCDEKTEVTEIPALGGTSEDKLSGKKGDVIYYDNSKTKFDSVYCYMWKEVDGEFVQNNAKWPGVLMKNEGNNIWSYCLDNEYNMLIFTCSAIGNGYLQTDDLLFPGKDMIAVGEYEGIYDGRTWDDLTLSAKWSPFESASVEYFDLDKEYEGEIEESVKITGTLKLKAGTKVTSEILQREVKTIKWTSDNIDIVQGSDISCLGVNSYDNSTATLLVSFNPKKEGKVIIKGTTSNGLVASCEVMVGEYVEHEWDEGEITKEATCSEKGIKTYKCTVEGCAETRREEIESFVHDFETEFTIDEEATCTESGSKSKHCKICDEKIEVTEIEATGHEWDEGEITQEATCSQKGLKTFVCTVEGCNETRTEETDKLAHDFETEFTVDIESTCTEPGSKSKHCSLCDEKTEVTEIAVTEHAWDEGEITKTATCTRKGEKTFICAICNESKHVAISLNKNKHSKTAVKNVKKATTKSNGYTGDTYCTACKKITKKGNIVYSPKKIDGLKITYAYTGSLVKPSVIVKDSKGVKIASSNYSVTYKNNKLPGTATVSVVFKGSKYSGSISKTFKIELPKTDLVSVKSSSKNKINVSWKSTSKVSGYIVKYVKGKTVNTIKISGAAKRSATISRLAMGKTYKVSIRTYLTYGNKTYYSAWSQEKSVKIKK